MSKYRHWWRPNVERALRVYPYLKAAKQAAQAQSVTPSYSGMPRGGGTSRSTENAALRHFSPQEEKLLNAVDRAITEISRHRDGAEVLQIVKMVDFDRRYTITGAALVLHMSEHTARRRRSRFVDLVGKYMDF